MIEVKITDEMRTLAHQKEIEMGLLNNSITKGKGSFAGFLGEQVVLSLLQGEWDNSYDHDITLKDGTRIDVKTKRTSVAPLPHYDCSVAKLNTKQKCDRYDFVRVRNDSSVGWYLGYLPKEEYFLKAKFLKKGSQDGSNGFTVRSDCYNVSISELKIDK